MTRGGLSLLAVIAVVVLVFVWAMISGLPGLRIASADPCGLPSHPVGIEDIREQIRQRGDYVGAEAAARELLARVEAEYRPESIEAARVLDLIVEALWRGGKAGALGARETAEKAVRLKKKGFGGGHVEVAASLRNLAIVLDDTGKRAEAGPLYRQIIEIRKKACGPRHPETARAYIDLAIYSRNKGDYSAAKLSYERALGIQERLFGRRHPEVALTLHNLGQLHREAGDYEASWSFLTEALAIREEVLGEDHLEVAWTLNELGILLTALGDYAQAESRLERALTIRTKRLGPGHLHVAWILNNLGDLYQYMGHYEKARSHYEKALEIKVEALGPRNLSVARTRHNIAWLHFLTGDYVLARAFYEEALAIREEILGPSDLEVATTLDHLAFLLSETGAYAEAESLYKKALRIAEDVVGKVHRQYAWSLAGLAGVSISRGQLDRARELLEEAIAIQKNVLPVDHPWMAITLNALADVQSEQGSYAEAIQNYEKALRIREHALGPNHPLVGEVLSGLALPLVRTGDIRAGLEASLRAERIGRQHLLLTARTLSERQALRYAEVRSSGLNLALSLLAAGLARDSAPRIWDSLIGSRALILDEMGARRRSTPQRGDSKTARLQDELARASRRLANLAVRGPDPQDPERYNALLDSAIQEKEAAERALALKKIESRDDGSSGTIGLAEVAKSLPSDAGLVAFVLYENHVVSASGEVSPHQNVRAGASSSSTVTSEPSPSYLAIGLAPGRTDPFVVSLGPAAEIDDLVTRWTQDILAEAGVDSAGRDEAERKQRSVGRRLGQRVWDPIASEIGDARLLFVVPDGALHLINFAALPVGQAKYLVETGPVIHYLSAERDLVRSAEQRSVGAGLLALGGPAFDDSALFVGSSDEAVEDEFVPGPQGKKASALRGKLSGCPSFQKLHFQHLPNSGREVEEIAALWNSVRSDAAGSVRSTSDRNGPAGAAVHLLGREASEAAFRTGAAGKRVVHLATHGFFLGGRCPSALDRTRGIGTVAPAREKPPPRLAGENPLLLAGLALAGANHRGSAGPGEQDGILTAEEIASMDLQGLDWAVLSACDTAKGEVKVGEGVLGLRRAFKIAGARTVIMSLWPVEDRATLEWMKELYELRLVRRHGTAEAVHAASLHTLQVQRERARPASPFYWAAFVASGDWR